MEKFLSEDLGPIQLKRVNKILSSMAWESKARIEKTNRINEAGDVEENESKLIEVFGQTGKLYKQEYERLFNLFNGKVNKANLQQFLDEANKSLRHIKNNPRIEDKRKPEEQLRKEDEEYRARMEERRKKEEEFKRQSIEIPSEKMGICLDECFDDSDMMVDYFCPHRLVKRRLLAIVKTQPEKEALARRIIEQIPELKAIEFEWKTEKYSMGHGNYLIAKTSHRTSMQNAYRFSYGANEGEVNIFYEATFMSYGQEIPHEKYYLGDLTQHNSSKTTGNGKEVRENKEKNGVEIVFDSKPDDEILTLLKANGWRWSKFNRLWYNRLTPENLEFANTL